MEETAIVLYQMPLMASWYIITSSIGRKSLFAGAMYMVGGSIISTVGLVPVLITGAIIWLL
jgi:hypothetical protein